MAVKVSIIIPTYNVEKYIEQCLESVIHQTLRDIEIIVSDDCSTDATMELLQKAAKQDDRIRILCHEKNGAAFQRRKDGVLICRGEYVMFVDGDDYLERHACERAYTAACEQKADIIHYGTVVENCSGVPQSRIDANQKRLTPQMDAMPKEPLLTACFEKHRFDHNIWNKLIRAEICKKAFARMEDGYYPRGEDGYAMFFLLLESTSYYAIQDKLYHYCFGRGSTGDGLMGLAQFESMCSSAKLAKNLNAFAERAARGEVTGLQEDLQPESIRAAAKALEKCFLNEQIGRWLEGLRPEDQGEAFLIMERAWEADRVGLISMLAGAAWDKREAVARAVAGASELQFRERPIRTLALYYHSVAKGGAQRVVTMLCNLFAACRDESGENRYRVVLVTDEEPTEEDYELSPLVVRETLPPHQRSIGNDFGPRARAWEQIMEKHAVDAVLYSDWTLQILLWDMLSIRSAARRPAVLLHLHNICCWIFQNGGNYVQERTEVFRLADGLITLSELDRQFWSRINPRVYYIVNPCLTRASENRRAVYGKHVLWLGRIAKEKQPEQVLDIMEKVAAVDPEVVCHVVGNDVGGIVEQLTSGIRDRRLEKNVILEGFHKEVVPFYEQASVFLITSRYEGFSLTLFEAASFGLPTVSYEMPWLSYFQDMEGWVAVPQGDTAGAAREILRLVNDPELWQERSDATYRSALAYDQKDVVSAWEKAFRDLERGAVPEMPAMEEFTRIFLDQITYFHGVAQGKAVEKIRAKDLELTRLKNKNGSLEHANRSLESKNRNLESKNRSLENVISSMKHSLSFRIGRAITAVPRVIRRGFARLLGCGKK